MEKVILAYSGGLDTSVILKWLIEQSYEVIAYIADVGQDEDFDEIKAKALSVGASKVYIEDLKREFVTDYIFTALKGSALYEGRYLLGTSIARPLIAKRQIEIAQEEGATYVSHGATGKGNDQVRFELSYYALNPLIKVIAPWKNAKFLAQFEGRSDLLAYADKHGIDVEATKEAPYSMDANLMHISYEAGMLEDPAAQAPKATFRMTVDPREAPDAVTKIAIKFDDGIPVQVKNLDDGTEKKDPLELFCYLNELGGENGIGRIDIVENRYVGIKSRGVYETPGGTILWAAHRDLETIAMDKEVFRLKEGLVPKFAEIIYNGYWFSPEMEFITAAFEKSQEAICGEVTLSLYKGNVTVLGRNSESSLYDPELSSMDVEGGYDQKDADGFIKINAIRLKAHNVIISKYNKLPANQNTKKE
ncbi:argininosuccinate synthase [Oligoflexia bacterium]|nr:argininosuccinate synthase [Oligoflexia bacterium]